MAIVCVLFLLNSWFLFFPTEGLIKLLELQEMPIQYKLVIFAAALSYGLLSLVGESFIFPKLASLFGMMLYDRPREEAKPSLFTKLLRKIPKSNKKRKAFKTIEENLKIN
jgi:hypothetical protein